MNRGILHWKSSQWFSDEFQDNFMKEVVTSRFTSVPKNTYILK